MVSLKTHGTNENTENLNLKSSAMCSIVIVNWKVRDLLNKCLRSIFSCLHQKEFEVIVIDNASQDGSVEMIKRDFPQVKLIVNEENLGFGKACNQGIKIAQGTYLFLLNPDTQITNNIQEKIINFMESHPEVGVGGCYVYYPDGRPQPSFYKFPSLANSLGRMFSFFRFLPKSRLTDCFFDYYLNDEVPEEVDRVMGGAMVLRKKAVDEVGLFDVSYFIYSEEVDLCYRMKSKGWKVAPIPNTKIFHHQEQSTIQNLREIIFHRFKSDFLFFRKYNNSHKTVIFRFIQWIGASTKMLLWLLAVFPLKKKRKIAKDKFLGYLKVVTSDLEYSNSLI